MDARKLGGLFSVILGLIFIIFPMFSSSLVSVIVGLSLLFFGISCVFMGWEMNKGFDNTFALANIILGIIAIIFGFLFIFYIDGLSFLISIQFYLVGIIMIAFGILGLISGTNIVSKFSALLVMVLGIVAILLAIFAMSQPIYIAIIIGVVLIIEGVILLFTD